MPRQLVRNGNRDDDATDDQWNAWICWGGGKFWLPTGEALALAKADFGYDPIDVDDDWMRANGPVDGPNPTTDPYGCWTG